MPRYFLLLCLLIFWSFPPIVRADPRLVLEGSGHRVYFVFSDQKQGSRTVILHDFPGLTTIRLIIEFEDDQYQRHTLSLQYGGYQKIFIVTGIPAIARRMRILSLEGQYVENEAVCSIVYNARDGKCRFSANDQRDSTSFTFHQLPELFQKVSD